eukprot:890946-Pyramimonas_sp.AAC.1
MGAQGSPWAKLREGQATSSDSALATWQRRGPDHAAKDAASRSGGTAAAWSEAIPTSWGTWS